MRQRATAIWLTLAAASAVAVSVPAAVAAVSTVPDESGAPVGFGTLVVPSPDSAAVPASPTEIALSDDGALLVPAPEARVVEPEPSADRDAQASTTSSAPSVGSTTAADAPTGTTDARTSSAGNSPVGATEHRRAGRDERARGYQHDKHGDERSSDRAGAAHSAASPGPGLAKNDRSRSSHDRD